MRHNQNTDLQMFSSKLSPEGHSISNTFITCLAKYHLSWHPPAFIWAPFSISFKFMSYSLNSCSQNVNFSLLKAYIDFFQTPYKIKTTIKCKDVRTGWDSGKGLKLEENSQKMGFSFSHFSPIVICEIMPNFLNMYSKPSPRSQFDTQRHKAW